MKQLLKNAKTIIAILVLTLSFIGCDINDDNLPEIFAGFTHTIDASTGTVTFMNTSSDVKYYSWNFGDGTTSTEINPIKTYAKGTYTVTLKITNVAGATDTYEDIIIIDGTSGGATCTGETAESLSASSLNITFKSDQTSKVINDGANFQWVANPKSDAGINTSCFVGKVTKTGTNPWDNIQINLDAKLNFNTNSGIKIKVFSAVPGFKVLLKLEDKANAGTNTELEVTTTKTNEWEELSFPFPGSASNKFDKIVLIFDLATKNTNTYYFDDVALYGTGAGGGTGGGSCTAETAESMSAASLNITFKSDQTANVINDGATFSWVANPDSNNAVNSSCYVGKITKLGNNPWDNNQINLNAKLDFNTNAGLKIKVYSAKAGFKVRIKLEDKANAGNNTELEVTTTKTSAWEELTFPFASAQSNKFDKIVIFFDLNANNKDIYYFDDLKLYGTGTGGGGTGGGTGTIAGLAQNSDFETGALSGWIIFQNGGTAALDNTTSNNGGTWSGKLETNGPSNPAFKQEAVGAGKVKSGDKITVKFDVKGSFVQPGAVFNVLLFGEGTAGASFTHVFSPAPTLTATWTTFTGTYTIPSNADVSKGLSFLIEAVCGGDAGCKVSANIDNVSVTIN